MVKYPLRVNTATFREWLSEFGNRVSKKLYKKLDYDKWRPMYLWSKPGTDWEEIEINVFDCPEMVYIVPRHTDKLSPNGVEIMLHENSFGDYLIGVMADYNTTLSYGNASLSALSNACSAITDATSVTYEYDTCTKLSTQDQYTYNSTQQGYQPWTIDLNTDGLRINGDSLEEYIEKTVNNMKEKENNEMKFGNFDFGPVDSSVRMSLYGMAIKNASGTYVAYDESSNSIMDVDILNFEGANKFIYKVPVALKEVRCGDVIIHARKPMFVQAAYTDGRFKVLDVFDGEEKTIVPARSPFGFDFMTKVVSFVNFTNADNANPFGNLLPLMLLNDGNAKDNDALMLMALMGNGTNGFANNSMMLYMLMNKDGKNNDILPFLLMGNCGFGAQPTGCSGNCSCHECSCDKDSSGK